MTARSGWSPRHDPKVWAGPVARVYYHGVAEMENGDLKIHGIWSVGRVVRAADSFPAVAVVRAHKPLRLSRQIRARWVWRVAGMHVPEGSLVRLELLPPRRPAESPPSLHFIVYPSRVSSASRRFEQNHVIRGRAREIFTMEACTTTRRNCTRLVAVVSRGGRLELVQDDGTRIPYVTL